MCLDVGASTGGFTDCLLGRGALRVHAIDVGHGQLHPRLRDDPRVVVWEGVNARHLDPARFPDRPSLATVDVSFISLDKVLPAVAACLADPAEIVALVKPQFEVGRAQVGKGGVVRAWEARRDAVRGVAGAAVRDGAPHRRRGRVGAPRPEGEPRGLPPSRPRSRAAAAARGRDLRGRARRGDPGREPLGRGKERPVSEAQGGRGRMRRVGVVARRDRAEARDVTRGLVQWLTAHGREVVVDSETAGRRSGFPA